MKLAEITNSLTGINKDYASSLTSAGVDSSQNEHLNNNNANSFADMLKTSIEDVNKDQVEAYNAMSDIATGKVDNLQEAVQKIEEAELSLKLGLEVKNKALGAYKQIMSMQI